MFDDDVGILDSFFSLIDFLIQIAIFTIFFLNILTKEGYTNILDQNSAQYWVLKQFGLNKNLSLIAIFAMTHLNQSKYIGISSADSFQYTTIRSLAIGILFLIVIRADVESTLAAHVPLLILAIVYLMYFICVDYSNSRSNQLAKYFNEALDEFQ